jgi:ABC-type bacteriocin/lantibiotic exporter with double-glycine peptidase domain
MTVAGKADIARVRSPGSEPPTLPRGLFGYVAATSWVHQLPLLAMTVAVFLLEVVPLELQRRVVNDAVKHRHYSTVLWLCAAYAGAVVVQGSMKLAVNIYRAWVGERAKRDLRRCVYAVTEAGSSAAEARGTAVSMVVAEVEPIGNFIGAAVSEPLLQAGILVTVVTYVVHIDPWMGAAAIALFIPQMAFVPIIQHGINRRTRARVWLLRQIGGGLIVADRRDAAANGEDAARIQRAFRINMRIFELKFTMNFLMNLCSHAQIIMALLLGGWRVVEGDLEIGGVVAFISGITRLTDPWGDLVNYFRDLSVNEVKFKLLAAAVNDPDGAASAALDSERTAGSEPGRRIAAGLSR